MPLPQTEMPGRLQAHFAERGIRMTQQRRAILRVMETASKHLDAAQLMRKAQKLDASVDRSTVYRTLQLLKRHGLIDELDLMHIHGEGHYYERKLNRDHIHMACLRCGKIMEFVSDIFETLKGQVGRDCRFRIVVSRLEIRGYCPTCSKYLCRYSVLGRQNGFWYQFCRNSSRIPMELRCVSVDVTRLRSRRE